MIRVAGKKRRGIKGEKNPIYPGYKNIDVTSASMNKILDPESGISYPVWSLSPIKGDTFPIVAFDGLVFHNFEMYWQGNKAFEHLGHVKKDSNGKWILTEEFFKWRKKWASVQYKKSNKNKRYLPGTKGFKPVFGYYEGKYLEYIPSRMIYIKRYCEKVKNLPITIALLNRMKLGEKFMILDGDGPPIDLFPNGEEVTHSFIEQQFKDPRYPFGHGYCIAYILYILYKDWIKKGFGN